MITREEWTKRIRRNFDIYEGDGSSRERLEALSRIETLLGVVVDRGLVKNEVLSAYQEMYRELVSNPSSRRIGGYN